MLFLTAAQGDDEARVYEDRAIEAVRARGVTIDTRRFDVGAPEQNVAQNALLTAELHAAPQGAPILVSSTLLPLVGPLFRQQARRLKIVAIAHRPTNRDRRFAVFGDAALSSVDASTLPYARRVIVPSLHTAMSIGVYGVLPDQIAVVMPGADRAPLAEGGTGLHAVSTLPFVREAGLEALIEAAALEPTVRLTLVGAPVDNGYRDELLAAIEARRLAARVTVTASADTQARKAALHRADLALVAWHYDPHGMHILEALARGVPVCAANAGAAQQLVPQNAGVLVPPFEAESFKRVFQTFAAQPDLLARLKQNAERARDEVRPWSRVGAELAKEIEVACR